MAIEEPTALEHFLDLAEERGHLTQADIIDAVPEAASDATVVEDMVRRLVAEGVGNLDEPNEEEPLDADLEQISSAEANLVTDSVRLYLREISRARLLSGKEEIELAKRVEAGDEEAVQKRIRSNLRLVVHVAKRYLNRGLPLPSASLANESGRSKRVP